MRTLVRLLELVVFVSIVWLAVTALRLMSGEPWAAILHQPLGFLP